jgi:prepilin-type N-terminal cleavage/methylation domain-containing protein
MRRKRKAFTWVELLVVIAIIALLMGILNPALAMVRMNSFRMACEANLSDLGRAMLIYANDCDNDLPRAGFVGTVWADRVIDWAAADRGTAFAGTPTATCCGQATISSSLYCLVKYAEVTTKSFVCSGMPGITAFKASDYITDMEDEDAWDFGPSNWANNIGPYNHCSYSYHMPYNQRFLSTASSEPGMAVAADRNPWLDWYTDTTGFRPFDQTENSEGIKKYQLGNTGAHQREGQNVLYMDIHVCFEKLSYCVVDDDNIYTYWYPSVPIYQGRPPVCGEYDMSQPVCATDSLLINECGPDPGGGTGTTATAPPPPPPPPPP